MSFYQRKAHSAMNKKRSFHPEQGPHARHEAEREKLNPPDHLSVAWKKPQARTHTKPYPDPARVRDERDEW
jgi:hypothetical protein